jgi:hypothetical protein
VNPSVAPSPSPGLTCQYIVMNQKDVQVGDNVTFTCGSVAGATKYEFRVRLPNGTFQSVSAANDGGNVSAPVNISVAGDFRAQCRVCFGAQQTCQEWEAL